MDRRSFLIQAGALAFVSSAAGPAFAQRAFALTRFSVEVTGRGRDVILIPGLTSGRSVWAGLIRALPGYRYHLLQVRGFAGEPAGANGSGPVVAPLAEEIARYIEERGLTRPALIGHSMGGSLAMLVAARHPERVGKVMVVDMLPQATGLFGGSGALLGQLAVGLGGMIGNPDGRRFLGSVIGAFSPPEAASTASDPDVVAQAMHDLAVLDLTPDLARIRAPMTIVYAVAGADVRAVTQRRFATAYAPARGARLIPVEPSSHMVMADQPQRFARIMTDFLRD